ncbi:MAG: hypothetical protein MMC23_009879 [Stictis urceolatum]|nr:hypothetical protein [Stictis urceolata]
MPESKSPTSRKRQRSEQSDWNPAPSKKQKASPPAEFWDNLSIIWLTKRALKELDRRNIATVPHPTQSPRRQRPATRALRKSRSSLLSATEYLRRCEPGALKDIKAFAKQGGPDLSSLRNHREPVCNTMSSNQSSRRNIRASSSGTKPTTNTTRTKSTGTYDRDFQQHLIDHGIYPDKYEYPDGSETVEPMEWEEINQRLAQPRPSLSPSQFSDGKFKKFARADAHVSKEKQVSESVIPIIEGKIPDSKCRSGGIPFNNLDPLTDGTLKPGNPDIFYGARPEQLDRKVRQELEGLIVPSTQHDLPIAPNFFLAVKGPDGSLAVAERQACYDGALGARGMHSLKSHGQKEPKYDNCAHTITSIYQGGQLKMYTSHPTEPSAPGEPPEYHMHQLGAYAMTNKSSTFREGAAAYRNARDWAKEQRDTAIAQANERVRAMPQSAEASVNVVSSFTSEASASGIYDDPASQTSFTSAASTEIATSDIENPRKRHSRREGRSRKRRT